MERERRGRGAPGDGGASATEGSPVLGVGGTEDIVLGLLEDGSGRGRVGARCGGGCAG